MESDDDNELSSAMYEYNDNYNDAEYYDLYEDSNAYEEYNKLYDAESDDKAHANYDDYSDLYDDYGDDAHSYAEMNEIESDDDSWSNAMYEYNNDFKSAAYDDLY